jgi:hypothetical protein
VTLHYEVQQQRACQDKRTDEEEDNPHFGVSISCYASFEAGAATMLMTACSRHPSAGDCICT